MGDGMTAGMEKREQHFLNAFTNGESRKSWLFYGIAAFLVIDAIVFLVLLCLAFDTVSTRPETWHLFIAPALAGTLLAILTVILVKGVFGLHRESSRDHLNPTITTLSDAVKDLSE